jgi:2-hydroxychromene-2-carboxylate isomerase
VAQALRAVEESPDSPVVEFFFAPGSRYCYLAASQMSRLEEETGCRVDWRPVDGREIRALRGRDPFEGKASGQYDWDYRRYDAECWADYYGVSYHEPRSVELDFRLLVRAAMAARMLEAPAAEYAWPLCRAVYGEDRWPLDRALCLALAERAELPVFEFEATLDAPAAEAALVESAAEAHRRGAFGVPTFFVGDQLFWGNDRLPLVRHALAKLAS